MEKMIKDKHIVLFAFLFFTITFFCYAMYQNYPSGTDEYWYLQDALSVSNGNFTTNYIFPRSINLETPEIGAPFIQNRPIVYIAGLLVFIGLNPFTSYLFINYVSILIIILVLYKFGKKLGLQKWYILLMILFFISLPSTLFSLFKPLTNTFDTAVFTLFIYCCISIFVYKLYKVHYYSIVIFLFFILIYQRQDFLVYCLLILSYFFMLYLPIKKAVFYFSATFLFIIMLNYIDLFPSNLEKTSLFEYIVLDYKKNGGNMEIFFCHNNNIESIDIINSIIYKSKLFFTIFFSFNYTSLKIVPLKFIVLISFLFFIYKAIKSTNNERIFYSFLTIIITILLFILILFQDFYRYYMFVIPALLLFWFNHFKNSLYNFQKNAFIIKLLLISSLVFLTILEYKINLKIHAINNDLREHIAIDNLNNNNNNNILVWYDENYSFLIADLNNNSKAFLCIFSSLKNDKILFINYDYIYDIDNNIKKSKLKLLKNYKLIKKYKKIKIYKLLKT